MSASKVPQPGPGTPVCPIGARRRSTGRSVRSISGAGNYRPFGDTAERWLAGPVRFLGENV